MHRLGKRHIGLFIVLASFWSGQSSAQPGNTLSTTNQLTIQQALELARTNYPSLRGKLASVRAAEAEAQAINMALLPQAGVQAQTLNATSNQVRGAYVSNGGLLLPISGVRTDGFNSQPAWTSGLSMVVDWEAITF